MFDADEAIAVLKTFWIGTTAELASPIETILKLIGRCRLSRLTTQQYSRSMPARASDMIRIADSGEVISWLL